jgi:hypothetical protein
MIVRYNPTLLAFGKHTSARRKPDDLHEASRSRRPGLGWKDIVVAIRHSAYPRRNQPRMCRVATTSCIVLAAWRVLARVTGTAKPHRRVLRTCQGASSITLTLARKAAERSSSRTCSKPNRVRTVFGSLCGDLWSRPRGRRANKEAKSPSFDSRG